MVLSAVLVGGIALGCINLSAQQSSAAPDKRAVDSTDENIAVQRDIAASTHRLADYTKYLADYTLALVVVALFVGAFQIWLLRSQSRDTEKAANAAKDSANAALMSQRPYVDISHREPGLKVDSMWVTADGTDMGHDVSVEIEIKNYGQTPADLTSVVLACLTAKGPLPEVPPYTIAAQEGATFLMPGTSIFITPRIPALPHEAYEMVQRGETVLYLMGYVEYRDRFGGKHRGGYARYYDRTRAKNNLLYVTKRGYNYDIEIDESGGPKG